MRIRDISNALKECNPNVNACFGLCEKEVK